MPKHSPGPWGYDDYFGSIVDEIGLGVAHEVEPENRPLIAAAPELLQVLRDAVDCEGRAELAVVLSAARRLIARLDNG